MASGTAEQRRHARTAGGQPGEPARQAATCRVPALMLAPIAAPAQGQTVSPLRFSAPIRPDCERSRRRPRSRERTRANSTRSACFQFEAFRRRSARKSAVGSLWCGAPRRHAAERSSESMADHIVPHFHNDRGVPVIEIGAREFMCVGAHAAVRSSARLSRHGRRQRDHLPLLLDAVPPRPGARSARGAAAGLRPDRAGLTARGARGRGALAQHHHRRRRDRRTDRGAGAGAARLPRRRARAGRAARGDRRRHPALAQRHAHPDRRSASSSGSRADAVAPDAVEISTAPRQRCWRAFRSANTPRARYGAPYWVDPSRRPAGGAARRGARRARHRAQARHPGRGLRRARQRRQRRPAGSGAAAADETRHRADRRRRPVVARCGCGSASATSRRSASAPPGARWSRPPAVPAELRAPTRCSCGSATARISSTIR